MLDVGDMLPIDDNRELRPLRSFQARQLDRAIMGHGQYGTSTLDKGWMHLLRELGDELADVCNYYCWAMDQIHPPAGSPLRIYIAGPYGAPTPEQIDANIETARNACAALYRMGHIPFCPHTMTGQFDRHFPDIERETYLWTDLVWLRHCHGVLMLRGWAGSEGSVAEMREASRLGMPIWHRLRDVPTVTSLASGGAVCNPGGSEENGG